MTIFGHTQDVADVAREWVGCEMTWVPARLGGGNFTNYCHQPDAFIRPNHQNNKTELICFELFLLILFEQGWWSTADINQVYSDLPTKKFMALCAQGLFQDLSDYTVGSSTPISKGHLVSFNVLGNDLGHVALATGNISSHLGVQGNEVITFWTNGLGTPPSDKAQSCPGTPVMLDTIERLHACIPGNAKVKSCKPRWR